jgi:DNA-binding transcriptional regulator YiaG
MAVSSQDILNFLLANPNMSDSAIAAAMDMYGVTPAMMAEAVGIPVQQVQQRYEEVQPQGLLTPPVKAPEPVYVPEPVYTPETTPEPAYVAYSEPTYQEPTQPEPQQTQEAQTMAVTSKQIIDFLLANPNMSDAQIVSAMEQYGVTPAQMATAVGLPEGQVAARVAATIPPGSSVTLGDTVIVPQYRTTGSGMDEQILGLESFATSKSNGDPNYKAPVGTPMQVYSADGEFVNTVKTKKDQSFLGGLVDAFKDPVVLAALGGAAAGGLFGGAGALGGAGTTFAGEALADASLLSGGGGTALGSTLGGTTFAGEALSDAGLLSVGA